MERFKRVHNAVSIAALTITLGEQEHFGCKRLGHSHKLKAYPSVTQNPVVGLRNPEALAAALAVVPPRARCRVQELLVAVRDWRAGGGGAALNALLQARAAARVPCAPLSLVRALP